MKRIGYGLLDIEPVLIPLLTKRLREIDSSTGLGNGTLLADAAACVLACDMARMGAKMKRLAEDEVEALPVTKLRNVMKLTATALANRGQPWKDTLPYKTTIMSIGHPGGHPSVLVGTQILLAWRGVPGLHRNNTNIPLTGEGARMLRQAIADEMKELAAIDGYDAPTPTIDDIVIQKVSHWRSTLLTPVRNGPGTTMHEEETIINPEAMFDSDIARQAAAALKNAVEAFDDRVETDADDAEIRTRLAPLLDKAKAQGLRFELVGITVRHRQYSRLAYPVFTTLGNDMKPTTWVAFVDKHNGDKLERAVANQMAAQRRLKRRMDEMAAGGGDGSVDIVTLAMLQNRDIDVDATLAQLMEKRRITVQLGRNGRLRDTMGLSWRAGVVKSSFALGEGVIWDRDAVVLKRDELPQTIRTALVGRPLSSLVEHEGLPAGLVIRSVSGRAYGWTRVNVSVPVETFRITA